MSDKRDVLDYLSGPDGGDPRTASISVLLAILQIPWAGLTVLLSMQLCGRHDPLWIISVFACIPAVLSLVTGGRETYQRKLSRESQVGALVAMALSAGWIIFVLMLVGVTGNNDCL